MLFRLLEVRGGQIEAHDRKSWPRLLHEIQKASGAATHDQKMKVALVPPGKQLVQRHERLSPDDVRDAAEQDFDLRVIALGRILGHPSIGLKMKILHVIPRQASFAMLVANLEDVAHLSAA